MIYMMEFILYSNKTMKERALISFALYDTNRTNAAHEQ